MVTKVEAYRKRDGSIVRPHIRRTTTKDKTYKGYVNSWDEWLELRKQGYTAVGKDFDCSYNNLLQGGPQNKLITSLQGAPQKVGGDFDCSGNNFTSLKGAPQEVGGSFYCGYNNLTSLQGAPQKVGGDFDCNNTAKKFTEADVKKVSNVKGDIYI